MKFTTAQVAFSAHRVQRLAFQICKRFLCALLLGVGISACGGGGGGGSSTPAQPSVTVSGNAGQYWQDEPIEIRFSTQNMDASTITYSVSNYEEGYDFTLDTTAGTFRTLDGLYTDAGDYALAVTATDGMGKTASKSFQFSVNAILTGRIEINEPSPVGTATRQLIAYSSREGVFSLTLPNVYEYTDREGIFFVAQNFICTGKLQVSGALFEGDSDCAGQLPRQIDFGGNFNNGPPAFFGEEFESVARITVSGDVNDQAGSIAFYNAQGGIVETWETRYSTISLNDRALLPYWPSNTQLQGRYVIVEAMAQYSAALTPSNGDGVNGVRLLNLAESPQFEIAPDQRLNPVGSDCSIEGQLSTESINEYASVYEGTKGNNWRDVYRVMSADYRALGCGALPTIVPAEELADLGEEPISINQSAGKVNIATLLFDSLGTNQNSDILLSFQGQGDDRPFDFLAVKICDSFGDPTPITEVIPIPCS